jgi:hypothetical protein
MAGVTALAAETSRAQEQLVGTNVTSPEAVVAPVTSPVETNDSVKLEPIPLAPGTVFIPARVGNWGDAANTAGAPEGQRAIYSNTLGQFVFPLPANTRFADDVTLSTFPVAPGSCLLRGLEFPVVGRVNPTGTGGAFTVNYTLYTNCPNSVPANVLSTIVLPGSAGQAVFADEQNRLVQVQFGDGLSLPDGMSSLWLGVTFSRANVGLVGGAPALEGSTCDLYDFPGAASQCNGFFGGFPDHAYGAMNLELFGDTKSCGNAHVGYRANRPSQGIINLGASLTIADDIRLGVSSCRMVGYEVAVKGVASYSFDLRNTCDSAAIAGTQRFFNPPLGSGPSTSVIARQVFSPAIQIPPNFYFTATVNNTTAGVVLSGQQACVGETLETIEVGAELGGCTPIVPPTAGLQGALNVTIFCEGEAPTGACCDMFFTDPEGEAVCRVVPEMNCAFPPRFATTLRPFWEEGETCDPAPFNPACGLSCCCKPDGTRQNLTNNQCQAVEPLEQPRQWQRGLPCGISGQVCPIIACLAREGECTTERICPLCCPLSCRQDGVNCPAPTPECNCEECPPVGCDNAECCTLVCERDDFCCLVQWDDACADIAVQICPDIRPANDDCPPSGRLEGATELTIPDSAQTSTYIATESLSDPGFGCYLDDPGHTAFDTHWYWFTAPPAIAPATRSIVNLQTCASSNPANDSLVQVFAVGDPTDKITRCGSLIPYGCNDDFAGPGCTRVTTLSRMCVRELIPGNIYYVMVGGKTAATLESAAIRLDISQVSQCISQIPDDTNDFCPRATAVNDGVTAFNLARAIPPYFLDQGESCVPSMTADLWFNYAATCTGVATIGTCGPNAGQSPDTNLAVYSSCPTTALSSPLACSQDFGGTCGLASQVSLDVIQGEQLKVRVGDSAQNLASGNLTISCSQSACPSGTMTLVEDGPNGIPLNAIDARRPHAPDDDAALLGTQTLDVITTRDAQPSCFSLCETADTGSPNSVSSVIPGAINGGLQTYTINLARPITGGAKTTIIYSPDTTAADSYVHLVSHPGNVNADPTMNSADVTAVVSVLDAASVPPFGLRSYDLNRSVGDLLKSSGITPADILEAIDLANGAQDYAQYLNTANPLDNPACP